MCHHNEIVDYIYDKLSESEIKQTLFNIIYSKYYNFNYIQTDKLITNNNFNFLIEYDYYYFVKFFLNKGNVDINNVAPVFLSDFIFFSNAF